MNIDYIFKIVLIGGQGVGKSSLMTRFVDQMFNESYLSTIGVDFKIKTMVINNKRIKLQIWDTAGQERFSALTKGHFKGSHGCLCVFDVGCEKTLQQAKDYLRLVTEEYNINQEACYLVANKADLHHREVSQDTGSELAQQLQVQYMETSAKENTNVKELFENLVDAILKLVEQQKAVPILPQQYQMLGDKVNVQSKCC